MTTATLRWSTLLLVAALAAPGALAQADPLGDEFIFFVDGTNVLVPAVEGGQVVDDPLEAGNRVVRFADGAWTHTGFTWSRSEGVDATASFGESYGESDTLYFRMLSDPANASAANVAIFLADATDDNPASREDAEAGTDVPDYEFRLLWTIPTDLHNGEWHDLAIPLPPATYDSLEAARARGELMDGAENWAYTGAWANGAYGVGSVGGFEPPTSDPLFKDFDFTQFYKIGPYWDNPNGGGPIFLDDVYIGGPNTDISTASNPPPAMTSVIYETDGAANVISWSPVDGASGYSVYASLSPITDITAEGVLELDRVGLDEDNEVIHRYENPHPSLGTPTVYYAVTTLNEFGTENPDVSASAGSIANPDVAQQAFIRRLTEDEANALFDALSSGSASDDGFPDDHPVFDFDSDHWTVNPALAPVDGNEDISAEIKIGYTDLEEWFIYGEVSDDEATFAGEGVEGGNTWMFDSFEFAFGHYDVRSTEGAGLLVGSPHTDMQRGDEPDYQVRVAGRVDAAGTITAPSTFVGFSEAGEFENSTIVERTDNGWRFLTLLPVDQIQSTADGDALLSVPEDDEIQFIPFTMAFNDADGGMRDSQVIFSVRPNVTDQWWNTPAQWEVIAVAGRNVMATSAEDGAERDGFALAQSIPNPTAGTAEVSFSLGAPGRATVEVFNVLGQRVQTVVDGALEAGSHEVTLDTRGLAAGVYVYRLTAGDYVATRRMTVVR